MILFSLFVLLVLLSGCLILLLFLRDSNDFTDVLLFSFPVGSGVTAITLFCLNQFLDVPITRTSLFGSLLCQLALVSVLLLLGGGRKQCTGFMTYLRNVLLGLSRLQGPGSSFEALLPLQDSRQRPWA